MGRLVFDPWTPPITTRFQKKKALQLVYIAVEQGENLVLGLGIYTAVFQADAYAIKS
jgi:hypothetical protein